MAVLAFLAEVSRRQTRHARRDSAQTRCDGAYWKFGVSVGAEAGGSVGAEIGGYAGAEVGALKLSALSALKVSALSALAAMSALKLAR